jgi:hypothetical protein
MRGRTMAIVILGCLPLFLAGTALSGEGVDVKITNDGTEDIVVTVYDMSTNPIGWCSRTRISTDSRRCPSTWSRMRRERPI